MQLFATTEQDYFDTLFIPQPHVKAVNLIPMVFTLKKNDTSAAFVSITMPQRFLIQLYAR